jgi:hypothetical protein
VVVDGDGEFLLGLVLADDVLVEEGLDLRGLGEVRRCGAGLRLSLVVFEDGVADGYALIADVGAGVVGGNLRVLVRFSWQVTDSFIRAGVRRSTGLRATISVYTHVNGRRCAEVV